MATIGVIETTVSTEVASTSTSFTEVVESSALTNGTTYYIVCHALVEGNANQRVFEWQLVDRTNGDAVLSNSTLKREPTTANACQSYCFVGRITAGSDGGGLAFEQRTVDATKTVRTQYLSMMILDLSNLESSDYFYANDSTSAAHTTSYVDRANLTTITPTNDDTYLMFGWVATDTGTVNKNALMRMEVTQTPEATLTTPEISYEGEDLTEVLNWWVCRPYTMTGNDTTFTIQTKDDSSGVQNTYLESTIFGLRLNAFENFASGYTDALTTAVSVGFVELESFSFTPDLTGDVIVVGCSVFNAQGVNRTAFEQIQIDGTTKPNTQPDSESSVVSNDATDLLALPYITKYDGVADTAATLDLNTKKETLADIGFQNYSMSAFSTAIVSTEPIAPINYSAVATQTFASGDVASESYNSGDVASETFNSGDVASEVNPS
jgi:hypothetical protein